MKRTKKWTKRQKPSGEILGTYIIGERVTLLEDLNGINAGTVGTVVKGSTSEYYAILWDGTGYPRGMFPEEIERFSEK